MVIYRTHNNNKTKHTTEHTTDYYQDALEHYNDALVRYQGVLNRYQDALYRYNTADNNYNCIIEANYVGALSFYFRKCEDALYASEFALKFYDVFRYDQTFANDVSNVNKVVYEADNALREASINFCRISRKKI